MVQEVSPNLRYAELASEASLQTAARRLGENGMTAHIAETGDDARSLALGLIPDGAEVLTASSQTLEEIGLRAAIDESTTIKSVRAELQNMDAATQWHEMRALGARPDVILGSVHAVTEQGVVVVASASGSQLGPYASGAGKVIWVVGSQKIVRSLDEAMRRIEEYALPLEDARAQLAYGQGSFIGKELIFYREYLPDRVHVILVKEKLGF
jgi:L-lactate utilization protein LutC